MTKDSPETNSDETARPRAAETKAWLRWLGSLGASLLLFVVARWCGVAIVASPVAAYAVAFGFVAFITLLTSWFTPVTRSGALGVLIVPLLGLTATRLLPMRSDLQALAVLVSLLALGTIVGSTVGSRVQAAWHVMFVAIISSAADVFSVYAPLGPTAAIIESPTSLGLLALPWPLLGTDFVVPILGVGDVVFASMYRSAIRAHRLSPARTLAALVGAFAFTFATLLVVERPIPALPFLGLAVVIAHPEVRSVPTSERKQAWIGAIMLLVGLALLATYRR